MVQDFIKKTITENEVVVFMKGTKEVPYCGFSAAIVHIFKQLNVPFLDVNVMANEALRQGIKDFTNWPTIPQIYVRGEFIGGCDIVKEMYMTGELQKLFAKAVEA